jgi:hypothetical protein
MAEVKLSGLYKVTVTEYERGWGQRVDPMTLNSLPHCPKPRLTKHTGKKMEIQSIISVLKSKK